MQHLVNIIIRPRRRIYSVVELAVRYVGSLITTVYYGRTAETVDLPFEVVYRGSSKYHASNGGPYPPHQKKKFSVGKWDVAM